ncbi:Transcription factor [Aspergillus sclerotialis]|uniref:Transcription factor n=1 Tax=Aspergillus sclerotialis TaxID=2070753 RepID=A0A3A2ZQV1_9EURO|nr:Transcription factor [Aspergillus sclerotialis]
MFIYREAFLRDHFSDCQNCKYWSPGLLLSMCALGLQMSSDNRERDLGNRFYAAAESVCIVSVLAQPSITTVQTILCLAFYALGQGDLSKSWGLSGIVFRMAQDLGFQKDPADWILQDFSIATNEDIEIRRRIYWGCYNSDTHISIILGRSIQLPWQDASVTQTDVLPDFPQMGAWLPAGFSNDTGASGKPSSLVLCFPEQIRLSKSIERLLSGLAFLKAAPDEVVWEGCVGDITVELYKWQASLPLPARWNK